VPLESLLRRGQVIGPFVRVQHRKGIRGRRGCKQDNLMRHRRPSGRLSLCFGESREPIGLSENGRMRDDQRARLLGQRIGEGAPVGDGSDAGWRGPVSCQKIDPAEPGAARSHNRPPREAKAKNLWFAAVRKCRRDRRCAGIRQKNHYWRARGHALRTLLHWICDIPRLVTGVDTTSDTSILAAFGAEIGGAGSFPFRSSSRVSLALRLSFI